jgi:hypothetical protein
MGIGGCDRVRADAGPVILGLLDPGGPFAGFGNETVLMILVC